MVNGIGDISIAFKLVRQMRAEASEVVGALKKLASSADEAIYPHEYFETVTSYAARVETAFANIFPMTTGSGVDLLAQIDELCKAANSLSDVKKPLENLYQTFSTIGVDAKRLETLKVMSERVKEIRTLQLAFDQLGASGVPAELISEVSESLKANPADRVQAFVQAQLALNEPGHLGDRLAKYLEQMEKSGLSSFNEKQREQGAKLLAHVETVYEFLADLELLRDTRERLGAALQIDALITLQAHAHRIRDAHLKLEAVGDELDIEARLNDFIAMANLPAKA